VATTVSISGSGKADVTVFGQGTVIAGNGTDKIDITGAGKIVVGSGNDTLTLGKGGTITEYGATGHDTIQIGSTGNYDIIEHGSATVTGAFGQATVSGGELKIIQSPGQTAREVVIGGHVTIIGASSTGNVAGSTAHGSTGGSSHDTMSGSGSHTTPAAIPGGQHIMNNFLTGQMHLLVQTAALNHSTWAHVINMQPDKTTIGMDGGRTQVVMNFHLSDISKLGH
jgi:hypothetical protein